MTRDDVLRWGTIGKSLIMSAIPICLLGVYSELRCLTSEIAKLRVENMQMHTIDAERLARLEAITEQSRRTQ